MKTDEYLSSLMQIDGIVPLGYNDLNLGIINVLHANELTLDSYFIPILDPANIECLKVSEDILIADPESAIVFVGAFLNVRGTYGLSKLRSPHWRFPSPVTLPLVVLKGAPEVK